MYNSRQRPVSFTLLRTDCEGWQTPWCGCDGSVTILGSTIRKWRTYLLWVRLGHRTRAHIWQGTVIQSLPPPSALELALPAKRAHLEITVRCVLYMFAYMKVHVYSTPEKEKVKKEKGKGEKKEP